MDVRHSHLLRCLFPLLSSTVRLAPPSESLRGPFDIVVTIIVIDGGQAQQQSRRDGILGLVGQKAYARDEKRILNSHSENIYIDSVSALL